ncbi:2'O-ribose methyltransferase, putative [Candida dubliniensis CD36]|uniref:rRNA methyltransferase 2, mitochondrial n=1 Tax=Candida dubliniensis (strain CD36 / ATCC MYA-646 / CBS 7987 / NCPF 3949 / NRRL Y-17841) TaxID=573826 RepID=B9WN25_CANDC|nr:2'O-ribose methyltransferase, putative [Candida dubliniensis CD36]CAX40492.1 2'O-ribose methyltransferase, putative [Candida dubliniensis CD36]
MPSTTYLNSCCWLFSTQNCISSSSNRNRALKKKNVPKAHQLTSEFPLPMNILSIKFNNLYSNNLRIFVRNKSKQNVRKYIDSVSNDTYANKRRQSLFKSRAAFKLEEIDKKYKIFTKKTKNIVDLGFAPGAWTQFAVHRLEEQDQPHKILGVDINLATPVKGCHYMQGDIMNKSTHAKIRTFFEKSRFQESQNSQIDTNSNEEKQLDLIMSDMMVDCTGSGQVDHIGNMELCTAALYLAYSELRSEKDMILKVWSGSELKLFEARMNMMFKKVIHIKPDASKDRSSELYMVGRRKIDLESKGITFDDVLNATNPGERIS